MTRLLVHVEGETEETFVNEVLASHLYEKGYESVSARLLGNARQRDRRGGIRGWPAARKDLVRHLSGDAGCVMTTMVDYYGLPWHGEKAWPGRAEANGLPFAEKASVVEEAMLADIRVAAGENAARRLVPFVVMHEFEGLLFSDCDRFAYSIGETSLASRFQDIRDQFSCPEEINDSPITAPSKRVTQLLPGYQKPLLGSIAILEIGLTAVRRECPHFDGWIARLEQSASS